MSNRGRRSNRGGSRRNFGDESVERQAQLDKDNKQQQIESVINQPAKPVDNEKKNNLVQKGMQWVSKHFNSMTKSSRGNVRVNLNQQIDFELYSLYESKLNNIISQQSIYNEDGVLGAQAMLKPLISTLIGIKLLKANTQTGRANMKAFEGISGIDVRVPGRLGTLIDNIGKSDAINDNVIRIKHHNAMIKQKFFDAIVDFAGDEKFFDSLNFSFSADVKLDDFIEYKEKYLKGDNFIRLYDSSLDSIEMINDFGYEAINQINNREFDFKFGNDGDKLSLRLPYLDPKDAKNLDKIMEWSRKVSNIFTLFKVDAVVSANLFSLALVGWLPLRFLKRPNSKFEDLDVRFQGSLFASATPREVLMLLNFYPMELFMDSNMLRDNIVNLLAIYKNRYEKVFDLVYDMKEFKPTEFGSSAIIVEGHTMTKRYLESEFYDGEIQVVSNKVAVNSKLKMKDDEALMGTIFKFNDGVEYVSNYEINYSNSTQQIRLDYIFKDFKM